jgi:hypothetical protein
MSCVPSSLKLTLHRLHSACLPVAPFLSHVSSWQVRLSLWLRARVAAVTCGIFLKRNGIGKLTEQLQFSVLYYMSSEAHGHFFKCISYIVRQRSKASKNLLWKFRLIDDYCVHKNKFRAVNISRKYFLYIKMYEMISENKLCLKSEKENGFRSAVSDGLAIKTKAS